MNKEKEMVIKKKKFLLKLEKEIKNLEFQLEHLKLINFKINTLKGLMIGTRFLQLIMPYMITAGMMFGIFSLFNATPFVRDDVKKKLERMKQIDSLGNIRYLEQYDKFDDPEGTINYVGEWHEIEDGFFSREIKTYEINEISEETVEKIVSNLEIIFLDDVFGEPILKQIEAKKNLSQEELQKKAYLEAILYFKSEEEFVIAREDVGDNAGFTLLFFLLTLLVEIAPWLYRTEHSSFDFNNCVLKIQNNYPAIDREELVRKLEIKKNNYKRLTR